MRITPLIAEAVSSAAAIVGLMAVFHQAGSKDGGAATRKRYLPEYTASGNLMLPKNFDDWVYVGSLLTPTRSTAARPISLNFTEHGLVDSFNHDATERFATR
jgi:hypothetical protein